MELRVDAGPASVDEQVERLVRSLYRDLRALGLVHVERKQSPPPAGSMASVGYELGAIVLSGAFSVAALKAIGNVVVAFVDRSKARSVEWEFGEHKGKFEALSAADQSRLIDVISARIAAEAADRGGEDVDGGAPDRAADRD
nr:hypothetical protein [Streptomyces coryli]